MGYDTAGNWSPFDDGLPINQDVLDFGDREAPSVPVPAFDGHQSPCRFTENAEHTDSATTWNPEKKELRLWCVRGVVGQFITKLDLKDAVGRAIHDHGQVNAVSLVFNQGDIGANSEASMNLRSDLSRWGFRRDDSFTGHGLCFVKDLRPKEPTPEIKPKPAPQPLTASEWVVKYRAEGITVLPPELQADLAHEQRIKADEANDKYRQRDELQKRIADLQTLKDVTAYKDSVQTETTESPA